MGEFGILIESRTAELCCRQSEALVEIFIEWERGKAVQRCVPRLGESGAAP